MAVFCRQFKASFKLVIKQQISISINVKVARYFTKYKRQLWAKCAHMFGAVNCMHLKLKRKRDVGRGTTMK